MAPVKDEPENGRVQGPPTSFIQVAKPYIFEQTIQECLKATGVSQAREDTIRLQGVQWIDNVRKALKLPVRTFDTAVIYYHKFRLVHADTEYSYADAAAAALFSACKIEDTLKKSRDILCAAYNLKLPPQEHLSPDDAFFEHHSRSIIGLERLMLEASGFDFRGRHPQQLLIKLAKHYGLTLHSAVVKTAYSISLDVYRTFAPLKQVTACLAFACLELAGRLHNEPTEAIERGTDYRSWKVNRSMVMETLLDLLELYTHYRTSTTVGPEFAVDTFLNVRIKLNEEVEFKHLPRFTEWKEPKKSKPVANGNGRLSNGSRPSPKDVSPKEVATPIHPPTPTSTGPGAAAPAANGTARAGGIGERGRDGTVRFMLNPDREQEEKNIVAEYSRPADDEVEPEQQPQPQPRPERQSAQRHQHDQPERGHERPTQRNHHDSAHRREHDPQRREGEPQRREHEPQRRDHEPQRREHEPQRREHEPQRRENEPQRRDHEPQRRDHEPQRRDHEPQRRDHEPRRNNSHERPPRRDYEPQRHHHEQQRRR